jgi:ribosomal protein S20
MPENSAKKKSALRTPRHDVGAAMALGDAATSHEVVAVAAKAVS